MTFRGDPPRRWEDFLTKVGDHEPHFPIMRKRANDRRRLQESLAAEVSRRAREREQAQAHNVAHAGSVSLEAAQAAGFSLAEGMPRIDPNLSPRQQARAMGEYLRGQATDELTEQAILQLERLESQAVRRAAGTIRQRAGAGGPGGVIVMQVYHQIEESLERWIVRGAAIRRYIWQVRGLVEGLTRSALYTSTQNAAVRSAIPVSSAVMLAELRRTRSTDQRRDRENFFLGWGLVHDVITSIDEIGDRPQNPSRQCFDFLAAQVDHTTEDRKFGELRDLIYADILAMNLQESSEQLRLWGGH